MQSPNDAGAGLDLLWWITVVELPALAGLFWLWWNNIRATDDAIEELRHGAHGDISRLHQMLDAYKLDVAKSYASMSYLKDVEGRLTAHLIRIEEKLDIVRIPGTGGMMGGGK